jgi:hypothetical protein
MKVPPLRIRGVRGSYETDRPFIPALAFSGIFIYNNCMLLGTHQMLAPRVQSTPNVGTGLPKQPRIVSYRRKENAGKV